MSIEDCQIMLTLEGCTCAEWTSVAVYDVDLMSFPTGSNPSLPNGQICLNAQPSYKESKWQVSITPATIDGVPTTACIEVVEGDVTLAPIAGCPLTLLQNNDQFWVVGGETPGPYKIRLTHNNCYHATDVDGGDAFKFYLDRGDDFPMMAVDVASWGTYATWAYKPGENGSIYQSAKAVLPTPRQVYVGTEGATYNGRVRVSARAVATGTVTAEIDRMYAWGSYALSLAVALGPMTASITVEGREQGATAGGGVAVEVAGMGTDPTEALEGGATIEGFPEGTYMPPKDIVVQLPWERTFTLPDGERLDITVGGGVGARGNPGYNCKGRAMVEYVQLSILGGIFLIVP